MSPSASRNLILEMVTSGKSGTSAAKSATIVIRRGVVDGFTPCGGRRWSLRDTGIEHETELADLHLVAGLEGDLFDPLPVDVGAVQRTDVANQELSTLAAEGRVLARD